MFCKPRRLTISKRLTLIYTAILFSILIVFNVMTLFVLRQYIENSSRNELVSSIDTISDYIGSGKNVDPSSLNDLNLSYGILYGVFDQDKNLLFSNKPDLPFIEMPRRDRGMFHDDVAFKRDRKIIYTNRTVSIENTVYYIQAAKDFEDLFHKAGVLPNVILFTTVLGILVSLISGSILTKRLLKPIHNISQTAKEITSKNLDKRITVDGPEDELKDLANIFNSMVERLEADFERQRRFASDASHELRTPLAVIHGHVNMLNRWGKNDPQVLDQSLATLKRETENMSRLIENLMYLAKGDSNTIVMKKEVFSLNMLLKEVVEETLLTNSQYSVSYNCKDNLMVNADYNALKQVLRILMDNSIKFSTPPGEILIQAEIEERGTLISVADKGVGIPAECLPYIFDRFYRVDESRSKATGGAGLGLAIAKQIVQSHDGTISAESEPDKGTKITVRIPDSSNIKPLS